MEIKPIIEFFGIEPNPDGLREPDKLKVFRHEGEKLFYELYVNLEERTCAVSADFNLPFGGTSLYEVYIEWDKICLETEPQFYGEQKILVFRKDFEKIKNHKVLMIMKWPNKELSVWPTHIKEY